MTAIYYTRVLLKQLFLCSENRPVLFGTYVCRHPAAIAKVTSATTCQPGKLVLNG